MKYRTPPTVILTPTKMDTTQIDPRGRVLEIILLNALREKYGDPVPVSVTVRNAVVMSGAEIVVSIPGQSRTIFVAKRDLEQLASAVMSERICDEVLFAVYLLLDEDEDE